MVKITFGKERAKENEYPKLVELNNHNGKVIVFASGMGTLKDTFAGMCIYSTSAMHPVGNYSDRWLAGLFTDCREPLTLENV